MKWTDHTMRMRRMSAEELALSSVFAGGMRSGYRWRSMLDNPHLWQIIAARKRGKPPVQFGRPPRRKRTQPRTIPWLVALPLMVWMFWNGELR